MALTEDFSLPVDGSWLVIPLTSAQTSVSNMSGVDVYIRLGALSSSSGFILNPSQTILTDETVYVRATSVTGNTPKVVVTR